MSFNILEIILSLFFVALFVAVLFRRLKLSVILGYLCVGALVGPHALGLIPDSPAINKLAEFGIVFLMFTVGLEFSLPKLFALRHSVFVIGGLQVLICTIITTLIGKLIGMTLLSALVVGSIVAMSSTAIVVKQLHDQIELYSQPGLNALGILLFQDLAVIPIIILIASLGQTSQGLVTVLLWALIKGVIAILLIFITGRWLLRPFFHLIAKTHAIELFTLTVLSVTLTAAWLTNIFGLSYALGAFLAGIMLSETEFRHQIEVEIRPFRDILLGLFFITIGMLTDISHWNETWRWILLLLTALVIGKMILITLLTRLSKHTTQVSIRTGLLLAQGGEFGFAILTLAISHQLIPADYGQVILAALLISLTISPFLIRYNKKITTWMLSKSNMVDETVATKKIALKVKKLKDHIIICGYGRVGQHISKLLNKINFPYIGLDLDAELIHRTRMAGDQVMYGDPANPGILKAAGIERAKVVVISFNDMQATSRILSMVRHSHPELPILVRCRDEFELRLLKKYGATEVIAELFEESLTLSHHLLNFIQVPAAKIEEIMREARSKDYDILQRVFTGEFEEEHSLEATPQELRPILIPADAYAVNHLLSEYIQAGTGVEIIGIRRGESKQLKPSGNMRLHPHDIIIVYGITNKLEEFEQRIIQG